MEDDEKILDGLQATGAEQPVDSVENESSIPAEERHSKRKHYEDHHVNRKYRVFSNHSSWGDAPHTNTSF